MVFGYIDLWSCNSKYILPIEPLKLRTSALQFWIYYLETIFTSGIFKHSPWKQDFTLKHFHKLNRNIPEFWV